MENELIKRNPNYPVENERSSTLPNLFLRSALFGISRKGKMVENKLLIAQGGHKIYYTGFELNQSDLDIWIILKKKCLLSEMQPALLKATDILNELGLSDGSSDKKWLKKKINRIADAKITLSFNDDRDGLKLELLVKLAWHNNTFRVELDDNLSKLFNDYTYIDILTRRKLKKDLTKWMYSYLRTNQKVFPTHIETYQKMCGSVSCLKIFKQNFLRTLRDLKEQHHIDDFRINKTLIEIKKSKKLKNTFDGNKIWAIIRGYNTRFALPDEVLASLTPKELDWLSEHGGRARIGMMPEREVKKILKIKS